MIAHTALAAFLIFVVPLSDPWITRWMKRSRNPNKKIKTYVLTIVWLWLAALVVWWMNRPGFFYPIAVDDMVKGLPGSGFVYGFGGALLAGTLAQVVFARVSPKLRAAYQGQMSKLDFFLPSTRGERWWFALLSVTAGICEEVLYRGFLYHYFRDFWHWGLVAAVVVSVVVFGLAHGYQGLMGIFATTALGALFAVLYLGTGTLLAAMVFHAALDLRILLFPRPERELDPAAGATAA